MTTHRQFGPAPVSSKPTESRTATVRELMREDEERERQLAAADQIDDVPAKPGDWPELRPLTPRPPKAPAFPLDALPETLREYVKAVADGSQTPPDWGAMLALAAVATVAMEHYVVQPIPAMDPEPLGLGVAVVSPPATRKSTVFKTYPQPIAEIEQSRIERWEAARRAAAPDAPLDTPCPQILFDDAGPEYLAEALGLHGHVAVWSAEGSALAIACGRYRQGKGAAAIEIYLQAMAGDRIRSNRCGKDGRRVVVNNPALALVATMQPSVLAGIVGDPELRGRGLVARIVWIVAPHRLGTRVHRGVAAVDPRLYDAYRKLIHHLATPPASATGRTVIAFDDDARELFYKMLDDREPKLADGGELESIRDWAGKMEGLFARLAALLALAQGRARVGKLDAARAGVIVAWALEHARIALNGWDDQVCTRARIVSAWAKAKRRATFSKHDAHVALRGRVDFKLADQLDAPLDRLLEHGYIRAMPVADAGPGRPASPRFELNPDAQDPRNAHNPSSVDCVDARRE